MDSQNATRTGYRIIEARDLCRGSFFTIFSCKFFSSKAIAQTKVIRSLRQKIIQSVVLHPRVTISENFASHATVQELVDVKPG